MCATGVFSGQHERCKCCSTCQEIIALSNLSIASGPAFGVISLSVKLISLMLVLIMPYVTVISFIVISCFPFFRLMEREI